MFANHIFDKDLISVTRTSPAACMLHYSVVSDFGGPMDYTHQAYPVFLWVSPGKNTG